MSAERIPWENIPEQPKKSSAQESHTAGFDDTKIDVYKLIDVSERDPVQKVAIEPYFDQLIYPCWTDNTNTEVAPLTICDTIVAEGYEEAVKNHPQWSQHIEKIKTANFSYPLQVFEGDVIDGMHRLSKLYIARMRGETQQDFITIKDHKKLPKAAFIGDAPVFPEKQDGLQS